MELTGTQKRGSEDPKTKEAQEVEKAPPSSRQATTNDS